MSNNITEGEIFFLVVPENRKDEIEQVGNYHFYIPPALLEGNVHRIACERYALVEQRNLGWDVGFSRRLAVRARNLSDALRDNFIRWSKDSRLVFFFYQPFDDLYQKKYDQCRHGNEWIAVLYSEDCRTKVDIRPDEEPGYHRLCITVEPYRYVVPSSLLYTRDGNIVRFSELEKYIKE